MYYLFIFVIFVGIITVAVVVAIVLVVVVVAVLVILKPVLLSLSFVFFLSLLVFFCSCCCYCYYCRCRRCCCCCCCCCCVTGFVVVVVTFATTLIVVELSLKKATVQKFRKAWGVRGKRKQQSVQFRKRGGAPPPRPLSANLPLMTLFSSLLPPKAMSFGFSILCVGEEAFTHLFVLQRRLSFALLCFHAFLLPSEYVWLSPSCLSVKTFHS